MLTCSLAQNPSNPYLPFLKKCDRLPKPVISKLLLSAIHNLNGNRETLKLPIPPTTLEYLHMGKPHHVPSITPHPSNHHSSYLLFLSPVFRTTYDQPFNHSKGRESGMVPEPNHLSRRLMGPANWQFQSPSQRFMSGTKGTRKAQKGTGHARIRIKLGLLDSDVHSAQPREPGSELDSEPT